LTWRDEFNGVNGSSPSSSKWTIETGGKGWGNDELETYTSRKKNVHQQGGNLIIEADKESFTGRDGIARNYTSARMKTLGHFSQKYGRFEARMKLPSGKGMWSAFWLLGSNFSTAGWPGCGEIDIMENIGSEPSIVHGSMHGPGYSGSTPLTSIHALPSAKLADDFHVYAIEWEPKIVRFYIDDTVYASKTPADLPSGRTWVFDHPFFIILNLAVGGNMPGSPDSSTKFPQQMLVEYVRVFSRLRKQPQPTRTQKAGSHCTRLIIDAVLYFKSMSPLEELFEVREKP
jgi:beta-glucanase (GH16 family)